MRPINEKLLQIPKIYTKKITEAIKENRDAVNLARGDSEFITPAPVTDYLKHIIDDPGPHGGFNDPVGKWTHYEKEAGSEHLRRSVCEKYARESGLSFTKEQVLVTHGGMNAIFYAFLSLLTEGDEILVFDPAYIAYEPIGAFLLQGVTVKRFPLSEKEGYEIDLKKLGEAVTPHTKAIVFTSPYNPCGKVYSYEAVGALSRFCREREIYLIHDENHEKEMYDGNRHYPAAMFDPDLSHTVLLNSMSRLGMGGWRVGWMIANPRIIRAATNVNAYVNMTCNTFVQECAAFALDNYGTLGYDGIFAHYGEKRDKLYAFLTGIRGITCFRPQGTCYLFPDVGEFFALHRDEIFSVIFKSDWFLALGEQEREREREQAGSSVSYAVYLYFLLRFKVGVLPGCCYGPASDSHIRLSVSVKEQAIDEAIRRLSPLREL